MKQPIAVSIKSLAFAEIASTPPRESMSEAAVRRSDRFETGAAA